MSNNRKAPKSRLSKQEIARLQAEVNRLPTPEEMRQLREKAIALYRGVARIAEELMGKRTIS